MADQWKEQSSLRAITKDTPAKLSLATLIAVLVAVAGGVWGVAVARSDIEWRLRSFDVKIGDLPKRSELLELEQRVTGALRRQMRNAVMRCPRLTRASAGTWVDCQVLFSEEGE